MGQPAARSALRLFVASVIAVWASLPGADAPEIGDTAPDTWVATDALGRELPAAKDCGAPRTRFVAMFYFLWLGPHAKPGEGPYDISRILAADPVALASGGTPPWAPLGIMHHWGEPFFGYYRSDDPWVLRKHAQLLADAGIDVVVFDVTNGPTYPESYRALFDAFAAVRALGGRTPAVAFLCPFGDATAVVETLTRDVYEAGLHPELWFRWEGKPLILANAQALHLPEPRIRALRERFTFRADQPDYFRGPTMPDQWGWLESHPQHVFRNARGEKEEMAVGVAQNAVAGRLGSMSQPGAQGRSFHAGATDTRPQAVRYGLNFAEQWERALVEDPQVVFVTGWNEWIAGRFAEFNGYHAPTIFVDEFDQERSRDIEPMRGGHGDDYYYQLVSYVRHFKGARPAPLAGPATTIHAERGFAEWAGVQPEYRDDQGDTEHRDHVGYNHVQRYTNDSGRNDLVACKVAWDRERLYFYVRTRAPISASNGHDWMTLLIDADRNHASGWEGYDLAINRLTKDGHAAVVERHVSGWNWQPLGEVALSVAGNELQFSVPRALLGFASGDAPPAFDFKWCDNATGSGDILDFLDHGDVAPDARFNFRFGPAR